MTTLRLFVAALVLAVRPGIAQPVEAARPASRFVAVDLPGGAQPGVASIVKSSDGTWWAAGSFRDNANEHRPGLWRSTDTRTWTRIETVAVTPYGEVSELYSVAASSNAVAALGAATGGAHGNPRTVSWILRDDGRLHEVLAGFELYNGVRQIAVRTIANGPSGWVIFGARNNQNNALGATSWTSTTGDDFTIHDNDPELSSSPGESIIGLDMALDLTVPGGALIAVGERFHAEPGVPSSADTDAIAWTSPDGVSWQRWTPPGLRLGGRDIQRGQRLAIDGQRVLIAGADDRALRNRIGTWTTDDRKVWTRTVIEPFGSSNDPTTGVTVARATAGRMIVGARVTGRLRAVVSINGRRWNELRLPAELPTGNRAVLAAELDATTILVGATSLQGGGLWRTTID
jgi:hypothetical protein